MKFVIVFVAIIGITIAARLTRDIKDDAKEFIKTLPINEMRAVIRKYLNNDPEVQQFVAYLKGDEWKSLVRNLRAEVNPDFKQFLLDAGIDFDAIGKKILYRIKEEQQSTRSTTNGIRGLFAELNELVSGNENLEKFKNKLENNAKLQELYAKVSSDEGRMFLDEFRAMESTQNIILAIKAWGFDLNKAFNAYYKFLGFN